MQNNLTFLAEQASIDVAALTPLQRILLVTDGTLTDILEAYWLEPIYLNKVHQQLAPYPEHADILQTESEESLLERKIILRGANSGTAYIYAQSWLALGRLPPAFRRELVETNIPLGQLWLQHRLETFKELVFIQRRHARDVATYLDCEPSDEILTRSYRVIVRSKPVMLISEFFKI